MIDIHLNQGWTLSLISSCLCLLGCLIIFVDDLYRLIVPKAISARYQFEMKNNYGFLIASLGFSSGCLLFTSLYRLLPHATEYLHESHLVARLIMPYLIGSYMIGIIICMGLNGFLHLITSESVVHCNHGDTENQHEHGHDHGHHQTHDVNDTHDVNHDDVNDNNENDIVAEDLPKQTPESIGTHDGTSLQSLNVANYGSIERTKSKSSLTESDNPVAFRPQPKKKFSPLHLFGDNCRGECKGYSSAEVCVNDEHKKLHYCELPTLNGTEHNHHHHTEPEIHSIYSSDDRTGTFNHTHKTQDSCSLKNKLSQNNSVTEDGVLTSEHGQVVSSELGQEELNIGYNSLQDAKSFRSGKSALTEHHHHVSTPLSRLFMIGIQTTLAITLHKLPEGFVTYITSAADSKLGIEIFLSLLVHNFIEGFLMCLPLYYLFGTESNKYYNKLKAVLISGGLGGIAQPLGAFLGYMFLKVNPILPGNDKQLDTLNFLFGVTIAITSGFLTVVSLSMFGSAIAFNNRSVNVVIMWCVLGVGVIGGSLILTDIE